MEKCRSCVYLDKPTISNGNGYCEMWKTYTRTDDNCGGYKVDIKSKQKEIINHYGVDNQIDQLTEECGELVVAIAKARRNKFSDTSADTSIECQDNLIEELADVKNLIEQVELSSDYVRQRIETMIDHKTNRELGRIRGTSIGE